MYRRILVLLDGSTQAEQAIPLAARIARATGGTIILVNTALSLMAAHARSDETRLAWAEDYLAYHISVIYAHDLAGIVIERAIVMDVSASIMITTALHEEVDLLMMCNYEELGQEQQVFGNIIQEVICRSPLPVLVVRESDIDLSRSLDGLPYRMVVPLDGSPEAEAALEPAALLITALAASVPAVLQLLYIAQKPAPVGLSREKYQYSKIDAFIEEETRRNVAAYLKSLEKRLFSLISDRLHITLSIMQRSSLTQAILEGVEQPEEMYSMLAMTPYRQDGIASASMGSILEQVLKRTKLPMLIIRSHLYEARLQPERLKEMPLDIEDMEDEEDFVWSLPWYSPIWSVCSQNTCGGC